jgi:hypothetical protein
VYFTNGQTGTVARVPKAGGSVETLARGRDAPGPIVVDGTDVFWAEQGTDGGVVRLSLVGGIGVLAVGGEADGLAIDDGYVYWSSSVLGTVSRAPR